MNLEELSNSKNVFVFGFARQYISFIAETESGKYKTYQEKTSGGLTINPGDSGTFELSFDVVDEKIVSITCSDVKTGDSSIHGDAIIPIEYK